MATIKLRRQGIEVTCHIHRKDKRRPLRKLGIALGSWTSKFYQDMTLVSFTTPEGNHHTQWIKTSRIKE